MREEVRKKDRIRYLINTEHHFDHIFGDIYFVGMCPIVCHEQFLKEDLFTVSSSPDPYSHMIDIVKKYDHEGMAVFPSKEEFIPSPPDILFSERLTLKVGDHLFQLFNIPGHTKGQTAVYCT